MIEHVSARKLRGRLHTVGSTALFLELSCWSECDAGEAYLLPGLMSYRARQCVLLDERFSDILIYLDGHFLTLMTSAAAREMFVHGAGNKNCVIVVSHGSRNIQKKLRSTYNFPQHYYWSGRVVYWGRTSENCTKVLIILYRAPLTLKVFWEREVCYVYKTSRTFNASNFETIVVMHWTQGYFLVQNSAEYVGAVLYLLSTYEAWSMADAMSHDLRSAGCGYWENVGGRVHIRFVVLYYVYLSL